MISKMRSECDTILTDFTFFFTTFASEKITKNQIQI